jgi:hypothetical protein
MKTDMQMTQPDEAALGREPAANAAQTNIEIHDGFAP